MEEVWKDIENYEGIYKISNKGRVKRVASPRKNTFLKHQYNNNGYPYVHLSKKNKRTLHFIHRLVATHYIPNPENKEEVNHIDLDKSNYSISNLEWVTSSENKQHAHMSGAYDKSNRERSLKMQGVITREFPIQILDKKTGKQTTYKNAKTASRKHNRYDGYFSELITKYNGENYRFKANYINRETSSRTR